MEGNSTLIYTVTRISKEIKFIIEDSYLDVWVEGEISNFKLCSHKHMYFSINDDSAQLKAVMFQRTNINLIFVPKDGMRVLVRGKISSYPKRSEYQIIVDYMKQYGVGELYGAYEKLKEKLRIEGFFNEKVKKQIPNIINKIGIITSQNSAALYDILKVINSLGVNVEVLIYHTRVQGKDAEKEISRAIKYLNSHYKDLDILLVGRGGGSIEDLWVFNTELVARSIFASKIPIVSCIGHEIDFTIADFVADMRAPTPSAAAEMVLRNRINIRKRVEFLKESINIVMNSTLNKCANKLDRLMLSKALLNPHFIYTNKTFCIDSLYCRLSKNVNKILESNSKKLKDISHKLDILSPLSVLKRCFAIYFDNNNNIVRNSKNVNIGDIINIKLALGGLSVEVKGYEQKTV
jgi:exodeoxyribonuclease VII large subunit